MADTSGCCGGRNGKHLNGCIGGSGREARRRGKQAAAFQKAKDKDAENTRKAAEKYVRQNAGRRFTTYCQPGSRIPYGTHMEPEQYQGETVYRVVLD